MEKAVKITSIIVAGILLLAVILVMSFFSIMPPQKTVTGHGEATINAMPDLVSVYFSVQTKGKTSEEASSVNSKIVDDLISNLINQGFAREDIQTQNFNIYPEYIYTNGQQKENGYSAIHSLKVEMPSSESSKIGKVIDAGIVAGAGVSYINFELSQEKQNEYKAKALKLAAEDSRLKAEALANGVGSKLGDLISVTDNNFGYSPWVMYSGSGMMEDAAMAKQASTNIQPSEQTISATVIAVYEIK